MRSWYHPDPPMKIKLSLALLLVTALACSKTEQPADTTATNSAPTASAPAAPASSSAPAASAGAEAKPAESAATWKGAFKSKPGEVTLEKEASKAIKVWTKDPGTEMIGDGAVSLQVPASKGVVSGEVTGVWGTLVVSGHLEEGAIHARLDPKDPNDQKAMTGVLNATLKGNSLEGTMRVASRNANMVREAEIKLAK